MYIRFQLLIHVIYYNIFGSMCCKWSTGLAFARLNPLPHQLPHVRAGRNATKCRECAHPLAEGRRRCPDQLERDRARRLKKKVFTSEVESPQTPPTPNGSAQTINRRVRPREGANTAVDKPETKQQRRRHLVSQNRGCKGQRRS